MPPLETRSIPPAAERERALRILARSIVRQLDSSGYQLGDMATLASEIIGLGCELTRRSKLAKDVSLSSRVTIVGVMTPNKQSDPGAR